MRLTAVSTFLSWLSFGTDVTKLLAFEASDNQCPNLHERYCFVIDRVDEIPLMQIFSKIVFRLQHTILTVPIFVASLCLKRADFASVNWLSKELWIISSVTSRGSFLMTSAQFGFSVGRARLIFVESPRNSGFNFSKTSPASSFDTKCKWTFPLVILITWINHLSGKYLAISFLFRSLPLKLNVIEVIKVCSGLRCGVRYFCEPVLYGMTRFSQCSGIAYSRSISLRLFCLLRSSFCFVYFLNKFFYRYAMLRNCLVYKVSDSWRILIDLRPKFVSPICMLFFT